MTIEKEIIKIGYGMRFSFVAWHDAGSPGPIPPWLFFYPRSPCHGKAQHIVRIAIHILTALLHHLRLPEHFSTPLYIAADNRYFTNQNVEVELVCCPGGTGEVSLHSHRQRDGWGTWFWSLNQWLMNVQS
ncbi:hypothetical protein BC936DRAFT_140767 [Jimgerdemannia flammicorona]|uniref:Uncharacterized protein n=1 Tax=Jimgerdemannia flammicorona TaxID=994334 RepID=A0A433A7Z9_9FUNG|nr:hypothetical protein BC936DRAFT_140767 [Jimgerdemannia flammicorona]